MIAEVSIRTYHAATLAYLAPLYNATMWHVRPVGVSGTARMSVLRLLHCKPSLDPPDWRCHARPQRPPVVEVVMIRRCALPDSEQAVKEIEYARPLSAAPR